MRGTVTEERVPVVELIVDGREWRAVIDTGFNGYLELPESLRAAVKAKFIGHLESALAAGQTIVEENYIVEFPFDGETLEVEATFAPGDDILIGTSLLKNHRLENRFSGAIRRDRQECVNVTMSSWPAFALAAVAASLCSRRLACQP